MTDEPQRLPMVIWLNDDIFQLSFIENGRQLEFLFSGADISVLLKRIATTFEFKYKQEREAARKEARSLAA
jgi:hypothetical protein